MSYLNLSIKNRLLASVLTLVFVLGSIGTASARPMFGSSENCNESTCWMGYKTCFKTTYVFWIAFKSDSREKCD